VRVGSVRSGGGQLPRLRVCLYEHCIYSGRKVEAMETKQ
jgi:hypothetical protein